MKICGLHQFSKVFRYKYKCLGSQTEKKFTWKCRINHLAIKVDKTNAMLSKIRYSKSVMQYLNPNDVIVLLCKYQT